MYLKKLELIGFKSFATRTEFEFVPGITVIVGPNGSGKSNVTDGIRWVLGEQSIRTLRGAKMEDVIFAGSDSRKPIGFCEVNITFGNESRRLPLDCSEVTVTRKVYRSGESEYFLNKQTCRLKDIHELFMDTGIGRDTYSMIGQGRIDEILSHKSDERRAIFEDAAGIVKYKTRKKEAEKKLEGTAQNLVRIHDLIYQLEEQIEPLIEKVEQAHEFRALQAELSDMEIGLYVHRIEDLNQKWEESCTLVKGLEEENVVLSSDVSGREASLENVNYQLTQHEELWAKEQELLLAISNELEKNEGSKKLIQEKLSYLKEKIQQLKRNEHQLVGELERYENEQKLLEQRLEEREQAEVVVQNELHRFQNESPLTEHAERLADVTQKEQEEKTKMIELKSEQTYISQKLEEVEGKVYQLQNQHVEAEEEVNSLSAKEENVLKRLALVELQRKENLVQLETWQQSLCQYEQEDEVLFQELNEAEQKVTQLRSQVEMLQDIQADHTGFFQGVKEILLARDQGRIKGIHGAVSQLIHVPKEYEIAIETALGGSAQHLVVENEQVGRKGILWLKEKRLGRATFLPLDLLQNRYMSKTEQSNAAKIPGYLGIAADLVSMEAKYEIVARNLLGLIVLSRNLEGATQIAQALKHRYRVVTLDGDVMNPGGSMSGGSRQKAKTNLLGRPRQLEELKLEQKKHQAIWDEKSQERLNLGHKRKRANQEKEILLLKNETLQVEQHELLTQKSEYMLRKESLVTLADQIHMEWNELVGREIKIRSRKQEITLEMQSREESLKELNQQTEELQAVLKRQEDLKEDHQEQITSWKVQVARLQQERVSLEENKSRILLEVEQLTRQKGEIVSELQLLHEEHKQNEMAIQHTDQEITEIKGKKEQLQAQLTHVRQERDKRIVEREAQTKQIQNQRAELRSQETRLKEQEVRKNRLDVELNHFLQKLADDYELSFERAKELYEIPSKVDKAEKEIHLIKQEIEALGEVHLGAIEEHERLTTRLSFLQKQEEDLLEAKKTLYDIIDQMETEMGNRFKEVFEQIRSTFQSVFVQMFEGGRADLSFSDPTNLLETGIEIVAQPPGKRLTTLTLLSGGERALTAIVLLFAILKVKPVPFCVFDEVEAALDETNLDRFSRFLQEFSRQTQFIVISHRKRTMESADVLYGVTMQESGVSQLVSVKLEDAQAHQEVAAGKVEE